ncbi:MAG: hypothetical protein GC150_14700 [Rhizobiales bacterium]|nr:hypothetical protein [Hyphomicrobiales bacterium]
MDLPWLRTIRHAGFAALICVAMAAMTSHARAQPAIVIDLGNGSTIFAEEADRLWHPASLTKLMTAYLAFEAIRDGRISLVAELDPSWNARSQPAVRYGLRKDRLMTLDDAIKAMIVRSANDVSVLIAESIGATLSRLDRWGRCQIDVAGAANGHWGSGGPAGVVAEHKVRHGLDHPAPPRYGYGAPRFEAEARHERLCSYRAFIAHMNLTAGRLGMKRTVFRNSNGLPDQEQVTTARDMGILAHALVRDFPAHGHYFSLAEAKVGRRMLTTSNGLLLTFEGADGMKTGFICASGYNIVASATRNGARVAAVVLGARSSGERNLRAMKLMEFGLARSAWRSVVGSAELNRYGSSGDTRLAAGNITGRIRACVYGRPSKRTSSSSSSGTGTSRGARAANTAPRPSAVAQRGGRNN